MEDEINVSTCRKCEKPEVRKQDGYFPDGRNKRYVDANGAQWSGRACPACVRKRVKEQVKDKRQKAKNADSRTDV